MTDQKKDLTETIKRVMRRRQKRRPAAVVEQIVADDGPKTVDLIARMKEAGFRYLWKSGGLDGKPLPPDVEVLVKVPVYYVLMAKELASWQDIAGEQFMMDILREGLFEAFLEMSVQKDQAARARRKKEFNDQLDLAF